MMVKTYPTDKGYLGLVPNEPTHSVMVIEGTPHRIYNTIVHSFVMGDVDDPDLYAAQPLWEWEQSEAGQWVMENAVETPMWNRTVDYSTYGTRYVISAKLKDADHTYFLMKYK
jgi:hypothetical protein